MLKQTAKNHFARMSGYRYRILRPINYFATFLSGLIPLFPDASASGTSTLEVPCVDRAVVGSDFKNARPKDLIPYCQDVVEFVIDGSPSGTPKGLEYLIGNHVNSFYQGKFPKAGDPTSYQENPAFPPVCAMKVGPAITAAAKLFGNNSPPGREEPTNYRGESCGNWQSYVLSSISCSRYGRINKALCETFGAPFPDYIIQPKSEYPVQDSSFRKSLSVMFLEEAYIETLDELRRTRGKIEIDSSLATGVQQVNATRLNLLQSIGQQADDLKANKNQLTDSTLFSKQLAHCFATDIEVERAADGQLLHKSVKLNAGEDADGKIKTDSLGMRSEYLCNAFASEVVSSIYLIFAHTLVRAAHKEEQFLLSGTFENDLRVFKSRTESKCEDEAKGYFGQCGLSASCYVDKINPCIKNEMKKFYQEQSLKYFPKLNAYRAGS